MERIAVPMYLMDATIARKQVRNASDCNQFLNGRVCLLALPQSSAGAVELFSVRT